jgi:hypothetical protein
MVAVVDVEVWFLTVGFDVRDCLAEEVLVGTSAYDARFVDCGVLLVLGMGRRGEAYGAQ